jgi:signal peptidase I
MNTADERPTSETPPKRWVGLLLAVIVSAGAGHFYLGLRRRAVGWLGLQTVPALLGGVVTVLLERGSAILFISVALLVGGVWLAQLVDLAVLQRSRFMRTPALATIGFAVLALAVPRGTQLLIKTYLVEAFEIPSAGMAPTLLPGDHIVVDKTAHGLAGKLPARGDVVVFRYPDADPTREPEDHVKRVIGLPGDQIRFSNGHPIINGSPLPRCWAGRGPLSFGADGNAEGELYVESLGDRSYLTWYDADSGSEREGPYEVPAGQVFVVGDNRWSSADSRSWHAGAGAGLPVENIKGRALSLWMALDADGMPAWRRLGLELHGRPQLPGAPRQVAEGIARCLAQRPAQTLPPAAAGTTE